MIPPVRPPAGGEGAPDPGEGAARPSVPRLCVLVRDADEARLAAGAGADLLELDLPASGPGEPFGLPVLPPGVGVVAAAPSPRRLVAGAGVAWLRVPAAALLASPPEDPGTRGDLVPLLAVLPVVAPANATSLGASRAADGAGVTGPAASGTATGAVRAAVPPAPLRPPGVARAVPMPGGPEPAALAAAGAAAVLLELPPAATGRAPALPALAATVAAHRAAGLGVWLGGALEPPDVPRLLALRPDVLCFDAALRGRDGALRPEAVAALRRQLARAAAPAPDAGGTDSVFVRDLVLPVRVGAYAHERGAAQRVRFAVQAWTARAASPPRGMADVFSYDVITDAIRLLTAGRHVALLETLAEELAALLLTHAGVRRVRVRLEKLDTGEGVVVGCEIERGV